MPVLFISSYISDSCCEYLSREETEVSLTMQAAGEGRALMCLAFGCTSVWRFFPGVMAMVIHNPEYSPSHIPHPHYPRVHVRNNRR